MASAAAAGIVLGVGAAIASAAGVHTVAGVSAHDPITGTEAGRSAIEASADRPWAAADILAARTAEVTAGVGMGADTAGATGLTTTPGISLLESDPLDSGLGLDRRVTLTILTCTITRVTIMDTPVTRTVIPPTITTRCTSTVQPSVLQLAEQWCVAMQEDPDRFWATGDGITSQSASFARGPNALFEK
jgi:hypothetical protein